ncbi:MULTISPECIES: GlsB/YeaQ/YmgE family stress response membrane protein [unclassified Streptomyces]|uniref:GlsB/YeaQ/YmgE family stress response membrane protein n=1 Tax=unclassified Streptomyces TaxID=2593676 RepID=UPI00087F0AC8|nr:MULTISPECIES: GlsB/YeaQ/YmgE family stress response membrane protein [unclassified Streptomyces]PBC81671.1 hypothetical protein BX261_1552 [Streptomyces sp. 2321.6]SDR53682.1 hypothetical protein SAMN05216511_5666 [Streptomyces sp. KS_16]SEC25490.1 hypothetical protein SAMN05428940_1552 [Streptomyces sp. 2133.1]SNC66153.1 hypothetical protein SAMN06272741_1548 [Streptomyces sp. 2114.4]
MTWLWAIIVGLVLGLIAKAIIPGKQQIPLWLTVIFGMLRGVSPLDADDTGGRCASLRAGRPCYPPSQRPSS